MSSSSQRPSSSSRDLTLVVESASGTPEEYFAQVNLTLGRSKSNTIHIDHPDVDRIHEGKSAEEIEQMPPEIRYQAWGKAPFIITCADCCSWIRQDPEI